MELSIEDIEESVFYSYKNIPKSDSGMLQIISKGVRWKSGKGGFLQWCWPGWG